MFFGSCLAISHAGTTCAARSQPDVLFLSKLNLPASHFVFLTLVEISVSLIHSGIRAIFGMPETKRNGFFADATGQMAGKARQHTRMPRKEPRHERVPLAIFLYGRTRRGVSPAFGLHFWESTGIQNPGTPLLAPKVGKILKSPSLIEKYSVFSCPEVR